MSNKRRVRITLTIDGEVDPAMVQAAARLAESTATGAPYQADEQLTAEHSTPDAMPVSDDVSRAVLVLMARSMPWGTITTGVTSLVVRPGDVQLRVRQIPGAGRR